MKKSRETLIKSARQQGYKPENLEKVHRLLDVFKQFMSVKFLEERLVLKGGTALNIFYHDTAPRLSVDIDFNYIGSIERNKMLEEKPIIIQTISKIMQQNQYHLDRNPQYHAGSKSVWYYDSNLGQRGSLEIDINYMYRNPIWPTTNRLPNITDQQNWNAAVLDIHELAAGKLSALFDRSASRDLFDTHYLLNHTQLNRKMLRQGFTVYVAMTKIPIEHLHIEKIQYDISELRNRLTPLMHQPSVRYKRHELEAWATKLLNETKERLKILLPLTTNEIEFIQQVREHGKVKPELITNDANMISKINNQPGLWWAIQRNNPKAPA